MQVLRLAVTERCPLRCSFCYSRKSDSTLCIPTIDKVVRQASEMGYAHLAVGGGEPLMALDETVAAINAAKHYRMSTALITSGLGLTAGVIKQLSEVDHIQISLGAHRVNLLDAYEVLMSSGKPFGVNLSVSPKQLHRLMPLLLQFEASGASQTTILLPKMVGDPFWLSASHKSFFRMTPFGKYLGVLVRAKQNLHRMKVGIDCVTHRVLTGRCEAQGTSFFTDLTVSRCAFGSYRSQWQESLQNAVHEANRFFVDCPLVQTPTQSQMAFREPCPRF